MTAPKFTADPWASADTLRHQLRFQVSSWKDLTEETDHAREAFRLRVVAQVAIALAERLEAEQL